MFRTDSIIFEVHEGYSRLRGPPSEYFKRDISGFKFDLKAKECGNEKDTKNDRR